MNKFCLIRTNTSKGIFSKTFSTLSFRASKNGKCKTRSSSSNSSSGGSSSSGSSTTTSTSCSSDSDGKETSDKSDVNTKSSQALEKLNMLLKKMVQDEVHQEKSNINLAKPRPKNTRSKEFVKELGTESQKDEPVVNQMIKSVQDVAKTLAGDPKQSESELLQKLLSPINKTSAIPTNLSDIVKGMKIDRESKPTEQNSRANQVRQILQNAQRNQKHSVDGKLFQRTREVSIRRGPEQVIHKIDLFGSKRLSIFTEKSKLKNGVENKTWKQLYDKDLMLTVTHPPTNYFQQMILWTEQEKIWKFPIDNEQGLEEEKDVYFTEHIFLEKHLEPWCPSKGPIRHFMELVCVGLSKNPYITVNNKKEHIDWYKNYFEDKKKLLQDTGAIFVTDLDKSKKVIDT